MRYVASDLVALLVLCTLHHGTNSCSVPIGYRRVNAREVLYNMDIILLGTFKSQTNSTIDISGYKRYLLTLDVEVDCVLKNPKNVTIGRNVKVSTIRMSSWEPDGGMCIDELYDIRFGTQKVLVGVEPNDEPQLAGQFMFSGYNMQGPYYYTDNVKVPDVMSTCGFQTPEVPSGGSCPQGLTKGTVCWDAASGGVTNSVISVMSTVLVLLVVFMLM